MTLSISYSSSLVVTALRAARWVSRNDGSRHPRRRREDGSADIRNEPAGRVLDGQDALAGLGQAVPLGEGAVPDEQWAVGVPEVAEDVRAADAHELLVELLEHELELRLVGRIDGDEFAAR